MIKPLFHALSFSAALAFLACNSSTGEEESASGSLANGTYLSESVMEQWKWGAGTEIQIKDGKYTRINYTLNAGVRCTFLEESGDWEIKGGELALSNSRARTVQGCSQSFSEWSEWGGETLPIRNITSASFELQGPFDEEDGPEAGWEKFAKP